MFTTLVNYCLLGPIKLHWKFFALNKEQRTTKIKTFNCVGMLIITQVAL